MCSVCNLLPCKMYNPHTSSKQNMYNINFFFTFMKINYESSLIYFLKTDDMHENYLQIFIRFNYETHTQYDNTCEL